jgi:hypothetical protein
LKKKKKGGGILVNKSNTKEILLGKMEMLVMLGFVGRKWDDWRE